MKSLAAPLCVAVCFAASWLAFLLSYSVLYTLHACRKEAGQRQGMIHVGGRDWAVCWQRLWLLLIFDVTLGIPPFGCRAESEEEKTLEVLSRANRR
jgi:hypothetical protein